MNDNYRTYALGVIASASEAILLKIASAKRPRKDTIKAIAKIIKLLA